MLSWAGDWGSGVPCRAGVLGPWWVMVVLGSGPYGAPCLQRRAAGAIAAELSSWAAVLCCHVVFAGGPGARCDGRSGGAAVGAHTTGPEVGGRPGVDHMFVCALGTASNSSWLCCRPASLPTQLRQTTPTRLLPLPLLLRRPPCAGTWPPSPSPSGSTATCASST